jgi:hypothetical protein
MSNEDAGQTQDGTPSSQRSPFGGQVTVAVVAGLLALAATGAGEAMRANTELTLARQQFQTDLVVRALEPDQEDERVENLRFMLSTNLLRDAEIRAGLEAHLEGEQPVPRLPQAPESCHPSYEPCVPIASDVDCAGGLGDGPAYTGEVRVVGPDVYGIDPDGNGIACEGSELSTQPSEATAAPT